MASSKMTKRSQPKKKSTARRYAAQRVQREMHDPNPAVPRSDKQISQGRFAGETPLTGEDRPSNRPGEKGRGRFASRDDLRAYSGKPFVAAPPQKRRPRQ